MLVSLDFLADLPLYEHEKPYEIWGPEDFKISDDLPRTNCVFITKSNIEVHDLRDCVLDMGLDTTGFQFPSMNLSTALRPHHLTVKSRELQEYLLQVIEAVKVECKARKVLCFDWRVYRKAKSETHGDESAEYNKDRLQALKPAAVVHQDESYRGGLQRLERHLTKPELDTFHQGSTRIRLVNVWKPLDYEVEDQPLALCDRRTVAEQDLAECDKIHPDHVSEGLYLRYRASQSWYWMSRQTPQQPVVFVTWDSKHQGPIAGPPHASFSIPWANPDQQPRQSIEVRLIVMSENE